MNDAYGDALLGAVGASIGRARWPAEVEELDRLLRHADDAMYEVKRSRVA